MLIFMRKYIKNEVRPFSKGISDVFVMLVVYAYVFMYGWRRLIIFADYRNIKIYNNNNFWNMSLLFVQQHDTMYIMYSNRNNKHWFQVPRIFLLKVFCFLFFFPPFFMLNCPPHQTPQLVPTQNIDLWFYFPSFFSLWFFYIDRQLCPDLKHKIICFC